MTASTSTTIKTPRLRIEATAVRHAVLHPPSSARNREHFARRGSCRVLLA